jgi:hypothetical protein
MSYPERSATRRRVVVVIAVLAAVAAVAGAFLLGRDQTGPPPAESRPGTATGPTLPMPQTVAASPDPQVSARAWLSGYRAVSFADPTPGAWVARVSPVVSPQMAGQYRADGAAGGGDTWTRFVAQRCVTAVTGADAVIPAEAPRSPDEVFVQVSGTVTTQCAVGDAPGGNTESVAALLELRRDGDQRWRVQARQF